MLIHPQFDPVALQVGPISVHWYGISYLVAFALFWWLARLRLQQPSMQAFEQQGSIRFQPQHVDDLLFYGVIGVLLGGRLGYVVFYQPLYFLQHPFEVFAVWQGGMSFHGGMLGVLVAMWVFARRHHSNFWIITDWIAPAVPLGLASGRLGNFINGELWGRVASSDLPWAMVFPQAGFEPRHPSQLYQFALEGILLFVILWGMCKRQQLMGRISAGFLVGYGAMRFVAEYFREPDAHLGLLGLGLSMGQWLSVPMIMLGIIIWVWVPRTSRPRTTTS